MDSNVDANNINIDTIDINIHININDTNDTNIYIKSINLSKFENIFFQFLLKTLFVPKLIEITCS